MIWLRQSTASQEVPLGYFVDSTDGNTEETGLTIANTDIKIWVTGATTLANKNSGGATHISNGVYYAVLDATDTATIGPLVVFVHVAGALTTRLECCVLDEAVYDALFGTTALATATNITAASGITLADNAVAAAKIATGAITAAKFAAGAIDAAAIADGAIDAATLAADTITAAKVAADVTTEIQSGLATSAALSTVSTNVDAILADTGTDGVVVAAGSKTGYALSAAGVQAIWDALTSALTTVGSIGKKLADWTIHSAADVWSVATRVLTANTNLNDPTAAAVADAVWDEASADHIAAGSVGERVERLDVIASGGSGGLTNARAALLDNLDAAVSTRSTVTTAQVATELATYDGPTRAEATADKDEILTQLPAAPVKNATFTYEIKLVASSDHVTPKTGATVTMTRSLDGAAFGAATGTVTEVSTGHYKIAASAADMNGDFVMHRFTATDADDLSVGWKTVS